MENETHTIPYHIDGISRINMATSALSAISDLCSQAAMERSDLDQVNADNFACLLGIIVNELQQGLGLLNEPR